jgi:hypothetical protein
MNFASLVKAINSATARLQSQAAAAVNQALVLRNRLVGAWIVEFEQHGKDRAKYGAKLLEPAQLPRLSWSNIRSKRDQALFGKSPQAYLKDLIHAL